MEPWREVLVQGYTGKHCTIEATAVAPVNAQQEIGRGIPVGSAVHSTCRDRELGVKLKLQRGEEVEDERHRR
jgi:hypothetical protein